MKAYRRALVGLVLLASCLAARADESIFWLDKDQAETAYEKLTSVPDAKRDSATWTKLGWAEVLYRNDADRALECFQKAAEVDPKNGDAWEGVQVASLARMNDAAGAKAVAALAEAEPDSTRVEAMFRIGRVQANLFSAWPIPQRIAFAEGLLKKTKNPFTRFALHGWLLDLYETQVRTDEAFKHWLEQGHVAKWHAAGLFGENGAACWDDALPPEREFKLTAEYPVGRGHARWVQVEYGAGDTESASACTRQFTSRGTCFYLRAALASPEQREGWIRVRTDMSARLWLNATVVGENDLIRTIASQEAWFPVTFSKGVNVLYVKFVAPGFQYGHDITLHHADGRPMTDLAAAPEDAKAERNGREARGGRMESDALATLRKRCSDLSVCTLRQVMLCSQMLGSVGLHEEAYALEQQAFDKLTGSAYLQFMRGASTEGYPYIPPARRENISRTHYERAVALDARFVPALLQLARLHEQKDSDKAVGFLQQAIVAAPECPEAWASLARIYAARGWRAEQFKAVKAAAQHGAGDYNHAAELARWHAQNLNYPAAFDVIASIRRTQELEAFWEEISMLGAAGRDADQLAALEAYRRRYPKNARVPLDMAAVHERAGRLDEAERLLKLARSLDPRSGDIARRLLAFHLNHNQLDKAREHLDVILAEPARLQSYDESSRRYLEFLAGRDDDWTKPWDVDTAAIVRNAPAGDALPATAHSVVLFEQRLVRVTGADFKWKEEDIHRVVKLLSKEAGENYGQLFFGQGDWSRLRIRELRVFTPDGRVLEMDAVQEEGCIRMPELDKGAILEFRITRGQGPIGVDQPVFDVERSPLFRRQNEPVLWSRYVVVVPRGAPVRLRALNMTSAAVTSETDITTTWLWEFRDLAEFDPERSMPPMQEVLPNVRFVYGKPSMEALVERLRSRALGQPVTADVAAKAAELTKGLDKPADRVRALYKFCVTSIKAGQNTLPAHTLAESEGQADELFIAFLQACDIPFRIAWVRPPAPRYPDYDPEADTPPYNYELVLVPLPEGDLWLSPSRWTALGALPNEIFGGEALIAEGRGVSFRTLPDRSPDHKAVRTVIDISLTAEAVADVSGRLILSEGRAGAVRQQLERFIGGDQFKMIVQNIASQFMKGIELKESGASDFDIDTPTLEVFFKGTTTHFAQRKAKSQNITFKPVIPVLNLGPQLLAESERKFALRASWADDVSSANVITIALPEYEEVKLPDGAAMSTQFGTYHLTFKLEDRKLTVERRLVMVPADIAPERYAAFAEFLKAIDDAEKRQVTVRVKEDPK